MNTNIVGTFLLSIALVATANAQLTRIIQTGDPIPDSPGLTAGFNFSQAEIDQGKAAFLATHEQFGASVPGHTLIYWDGSSLVRVADDDTAVPGLPGQTLRFNNVFVNHAVSFDVHLDPTIVFWASYKQVSGEDYALYRWRPGVDLETYLAPDNNISNVQPGVIRDGTVVFSSLQGVGDPADDGLHRIESNGTISKLFSPGDEINGDPGENFDHLFDSYFFNGLRVVANINASPTSRSGWWGLRATGAPAANPILLIGEDFMTNDFNYFTTNVMGIDQTGNPSGSAVAKGVGTRNGASSEAILYQAHPGVGFQVILQKGDTTPGAPGYAFHSFDAFEIRAGSIVFGAASRDSNANQIHGIYVFETPGISTLIDTREPVDGKDVSYFTLHDRDATTNAVLFSAAFEDFSAALYTIPAGLPQPDYDSWAQTEFPDANGDQSILGQLADPDEDGIANLIEFALGGSGNTPDPSQSSPKVTNHDFEYRRRTVPDTISVTPQIATSLSGPWLSGPVSLEEISTTPDPQNPDLTIVRIRSLLPNAPGELFFRVSVSSSP